MRLSIPATSPWMLVLLALALAATATFLRPK
jgi:hypothetical protein